MRGKAVTAELVADEIRWILVAESPTETSFKSTWDVTAETLTP